MPLLREVNDFKIQKERLNLEMSTSNIRQGFSLNLFVAQSLFPFISLLLIFAQSFSLVYYLFLVLPRDVLSLHLKNCYRTTPILTGCSWTAEAGETIAFVGHSGCGKSTSVSDNQQLIDNHTMYRLDC